MIKKGISCKSDSMEQRELNELIHVTNSEYSKYESLLMQRDDYEKQARCSLTGYIHEFGEEENQLFAQQIKCIELKKSITICQVCVNLGEPIDQDAMKKMIDKEMKKYKKKLRDMINESKACRKLNYSSRRVVMEVKKMYHNIAKMIHPDINPNTKDIPGINELWNRCVIAYQVNALDEMKDIEVLASKALKDNGFAGQEIEIPDIRKKIKDLKAEITKIITTEPYTYEKILNDPEEGKMRHETIRDSIKEYKDYEKNLNEILADMLADGAVIKMKM